MTEFDYYTKANTGEVLPGAISPLSLSVTARLLDVGIQITMKEVDGKMSFINPYYHGRMTINHMNQVFINVIESFQRDIEEKITPEQKAIDMAIFGHL